ncbi:MAG TPA: hypothetical protein VF590_17585, partial [Isosphaeraceae bacterium]
MSTDQKSAGQPAQLHRGVGVKIYTYPKIIFIWPTLVISLICGLGMWSLGDELHATRGATATASVSGATTTDGGAVAGAGATSA